MPALVCLNGEVMPADEARVSVWDRGFVFGDAVYEVDRLYHGRMWLEAAHTQRLRRSLAALEFPPLDLDRLAGRVRETIAASAILEGIVYVQITRGVAPRRHAFPAAGVPPTEMIAILPYDDGPTARLRETGVNVLIHPETRWKRCDIKTVNLLGNVIANEAAHRANAYEAVFYDERGLVTEATHSSLLWIRDGRIGGTPEGHEILPGTTRDCVLGLARDAGIPFETGRVTVAELAAAEEVFLVGTTIEVLPVTHIDGRPITNGVPGPITRELQTQFRNALDRWLAA